jgi:hypothetical protein
VSSEQRYRERVLEPVAGVVSDEFPTYVVRFVAGGAMTE